MNEPFRPCTDCGHYTGSPNGMGEDYMVTNKVWAEAVNDERGAQFLCIRCLEQRLGRKLQPKDFIDAPVNRPWEMHWQYDPTVPRPPSSFSSLRLRSRLGWR